MRHDPADEAGRADVQEEPSLEGLPWPSASFRRRAWLEFQRAIDPLASPKPLPWRRPRGRDGFEHRAVR